MIIYLYYFLVIRIMHVLCSGNNCVTKDTFPVSMLIRTIKVFYYDFIIHHHNIIILWIWMLRCKTLNKNYIISGCNNSRSWSFWWAPPSSLSLSPSPTRSSLSSWRCTTRISLSRRREIPRGMGTLSVPSTSASYRTSLSAFRTHTWRCSNAQTSFSTGL